MLYTPNAIYSMIPDPTKECVGTAFQLSIHSQGAAWAGFSKGIGICNPHRIWMKALFKGQCMKTSEIAAELSANGYVLLRQHFPSMSTTSAMEKIGEVDTIDGLTAIQHLIPKALADAKPNTYSGNFGSGEFPLHTDLAHWARPPRYVALRCVSGRPDVATRIFDGDTMIREFGIDELRMVVVQPRRPIGNGTQLLRLLERVDDIDRLRIRWDCIYIRPATPRSETTFERIVNFVSNVKPIEIVLLHPGDTLLVDNWRMLHGRSATPLNERSRHIERAYMRFIS
ncbi:TauD/TfdA family dioxygenase [Ralstonia solanacearum]|nr:TauD/TfdA family dioxygenase [Ralstonia solanacearum]